MSEKTLKQKKELQDKERQAYDFYVSKGWTPEQAIGIVGNLKHESNFNTTAEGDIGYKGGSSRGIAQWRGDRLNKLKEIYGEKWTDFKNQLEFVDWELRNTEKGAGEKLKNSENAWQSAQVISDFYERPKVKFNEDKRRQENLINITKRLKGEEIFKPTYANSVAPYLQEDVVTNDVNYLDYLPQTTTFAPTLEVKEEPSVDKEIERVETETKELNFLEAVQNIPKEEYNYLQPQQVQQQSIQPIDYVQQYEQISQFVDNPVLQQGGKLYVESKNDPRYKAYQDSLYLYETNKDLKERIKNGKTHTNFFSPKIPFSKDIVNDATIRTGEQDQDLSFIKPLHYEKISKRVKNPESKWYNNKLESILYTNKVGQYKKPTQPVEILANKDIKTDIVNEKLFIGEKQKYLNLDETQQNNPFENYKFDLIPEAQIPTSYNIKYTSDRMNEAKGYYDGNNQQNVSYEVALRAKQKAEAYNNYVQNKYGNSETLNNHKAQERLRQLKDTTTIIPNYQQGGIGNLTPEQEQDIEKQREWLNQWNENRIVRGERVGAKNNIPFSQEIYIDDLNYNSNKPSKTLGEFDPVSNRILFDVNYTERTGIPTHEFSHRFQKDLKKTDEVKYNKYIADPINKYLKKSGNFTPYQLDPEETHSEINRLRYSEGFKPTQKIQESDLNNVDLNKYNFKQFSKEEIIDILNSTVNIQKPTNSFIAQQGGEFSKNELAFLSELAIKDNKGYWNPNNQGKIVEIEGKNITMKGVSQDLIGIGIDKKGKKTEQKLMKSGKNYSFDGATKVIELPVIK